MLKYKIIVCDHIHNAGIEFLKKQNDIEMLDYSNLPKIELLSKIGDADVVITRSSTDIDNKFLQSAYNLKALVRAGVGVDNVDIESCSKRGIVVMNVPTANTIAAVELTMAHMINAVRNFPSANHQLKNEKIWKREDWYGTELKDKTLGIIGFGNIGSRVAARAKAFEMDIIAYDPYIKESIIIDSGVRVATSLDMILKCDIITIHTPKNTETKNIITKKEIDKMKDGVILINCARGGLYNETDILEAAKSKKIRWLGIDVFDKEPSNSNPLLSLDNIYVTPHIGANTLESQEKISIQAATIAAEAARGSSYPNALNLPIKENELPYFVKPYLELSQKIGFFISQISKGAIRTLNITCSGKIASYANSLATFGTLGVLKHSLGDSINYVNAMFVAKERGINININTKDGGASIYKNLITIEAASANNSISISGCVFDEDKLRIVDINGFSMDIEPLGKIVLFRNTDVPGVIGNIGKIMEKSNINIADFRLARNNNEALAMIIVDNNISNSTLDELSKIQACLSVNYVVI
ncbi:phosphoglycerate dehydrogenase [Helicobacter sp. MIT 14-3879]|uniref:phosphoglycerate dehydrogenase n=1 Tax=Helicobacter sp. MIT 14-3879 TaxID=2040649 RepID=UPI000E1ED829|nr:phosphoglycerate dehydrogenase [Helicobacter sp. MIT 14-3879]RDU64162.1 phosphoglycerate dehydrogenase [Helicobacter sp. MIT 14-3879]